MADTRSPPPTRPLLRGVSHEIAAGVALAGLVALVLLAPGPPQGSTSRWRRERSGRWQAEGPRVRGDPHRLPRGSGGRAVRGSSGQAWRG